METKPLVIYHAGCWDGFCAAWVARKALGECDFHAAHYGTEPPDVTGRQVFILDFSYPRNVMVQIVGSAAWTCVIDHHKTAEQELRRLDEVLAPDLTVVFDMEKSGGRLAWEYFWDWRFNHLDVMARPFCAPVRRDLAPWPVDYTEDRDLWRHALEGTEEINAALRSYPLDFELWDQLEQKDPRSTLYYEGKVIRRTERQIVETHLRHARQIDMDGHQIKAVNATVLFSEIAGELAKGAPFGACYFDRFDGKRQWSLRSDDNGLDVSLIAKAHGGGGHQHAAGFEEAI